MKKYILAALMVVGLSGCGTLIPSTHDANEARSITDIQYLLHKFNCNDSLGYTASSFALIGSINWLEIYTKNRGDEDIFKMVGTLDSTVTEFYSRTSKEKDASKEETYCSIKLDIMIAQADAIAKAINNRRQ